ncbi:MAG: hypothetical protein ACE5I9_00600 [Candidatus Methylomirabilales bacterium]
MVGGWNCRGENAVENSDEAHLSAYIKKGVVTQDCPVTFSSTGRTRRVEVKSSARHGFQELKDKDLLADTLVWIHFGKRFHEGSGAIQIVILDNPGKHILGPVRLDIPRLMRKVGDTSDLRQIEVADLQSFLLSAEQ